MNDRTHWTRALVVVAGLVGAMGGSAFGQTTPSSSSTAATPTFRSTGIPQRDTIARMMRPVSNVDLSEQRLEEVVKFIITLTGADLEFMWSDGSNSGLDKDLPITLKLQRGTAMQLLEKVLEKVPADTAANACTWQMTESGTMQVGPRDRLNVYRRVVVYTITDLIQDIPNWPDAPEFDLQSVLQNSGTGGGSSQSPFRDNQQQRRDTRTFQQRADDLKAIIVKLVEPDQWEDNGGTAATIQYFQGNFLVNAPDYVHRGLNGYPYWPASSTRVSTTGGRRYVTLGTDAAIARLTGFANQPVTGVVGGTPAGGGGGSGRPPEGPGPGGGSTEKPKKK